LILGFLLILVYFLLDHLIYFAHVELVPQVTKHCVYSIRFDYATRSKADAVLNLQEAFYLCQRRIAYVIARVVDALQTLGVTYCFEERGHLTEWLLLPHRISSRFPCFHVSPCRRLILNNGLIAFQFDLSR